MIKSFGVMKLFSVSRTSQARVHLSLFLILTFQFCGHAAMAAGDHDGANLGNTISGNIVVVTISGEHKKDRSNFVVFVDGISTPYQAQQPQDIPRIGHKGKRFSPEIMPIVRGSSIDFFNDDNIFHNVFSLSKTKPFDLGVYPKGTSKLVSFDRTGLVKIYCNLHPNMVGNILILNNPYYAVTDTNGDYSINGVPDGQYRLRVWHELSAEIDKSIDLTEGNSHSHSFTIRETRKRVKHRNKYGKPYKEKY